MGFLRKLLGGSGTQTGPKIPNRAQPETVDTAELCWQTLQDLVDGINKAGPSGSLVGLPLPQRVKLRDEISVIGERLGTNRAKVKNRHPEYVSHTVGAICAGLAEQAKSDPFCQLPIDPADDAAPSIAQRCAELAEESLDLERKVDRERKLEHDRQKL